MWPVEESITIENYPYVGDYCHKDGYNVYAQCMEDRNWNYASDYCKEIGYYDSVIGEDKATLVWKETGCHI